MEKSCPFCRHDQFGERLIRTMGSFSVVPTLGQITDGGYLLLISKGHIPCLGEVADTRELEVVVAHVRSALAKAYTTPDVTLFEHGIVGQTVFHAHLHLLPGSVAIGERVRKDFPAHAIEEFADFHAFHFAYALERRPYLLWREPGGKLSVCWDPPAVPQYLRIVVAEALGRPERANWRTMDAALDRKLYLETVVRLEPHLPQDS